MNQPSIDLAPGALSQEDWFNLAECASQRADLTLREAVDTSDPGLRLSALDRVPREVATVRSHYHLRYLRWPIQ
jgi:hypothetical protein